MGQYLNLAQGVLDRIKGQPITKSSSPSNNQLDKPLSRIRVVHPRWGPAWQELALLTWGFEKTDPRYDPVVKLLEKCDTAFEQDQ